MFRITMHDDPQWLTLQLEGRLVGPWVPEAQDCLQRVLASHETGGRMPKHRLDLTGLTMIDEAGKAFLAAAHAQGAELASSGCLMPAIVAEITGRPISDGGCQWRNIEKFGDGVDPCPPRSTCSTK